MSFNDAYETILGNKADCVILNLWSALNYGAILTCLGVQFLVEKLGYSAKIINYIPKIKLKFEDSFSDEFSKKYLNLSTPINNYSDLFKLNEHCENFIVGSDQVWNENLMKSHSRETSSAIWLLNFVDKTKRKLSYSASFGCEFFPLTKEMENLFKFYIPQFDAISVREDDGVNILKEHFNIDSPQLIDGAFHIPIEFLDEITKRYKKEEDYIACFFLPYYAKKKWYKKLTVEIQKKIGLPIKYFNFKDNVSVEEWLAFIKNSSFVITDSFHSVVFSILFEKNFIQIQNNPNTQIRFNSLYKLLKLDNLVIKENMENIEIDKLSIERDWASARAIYQKEVKKAEIWLKNVLETPVKNKESFELSNKVLVDCNIKNKQLEKLVYYSFQKDIIKRKYLTAKILSKITFGKTRKKYKTLRKKLKLINAEIKNITKMDLNIFM